MIGHRIRHLPISYRIATTNPQLNPQPTQLITNNPQQTDKTPQDKFTHTAQTYSTDFVPLNPPLAHCPNAPPTTKPSDTADASTLQYIGRSTRSKDPRIPLVNSSYGINLIRASLGPVGSKVQRPLRLDRFGQGRSR